jgi:hypothetical protein
MKKIVLQFEAEAGVAENELVDEANDKAHPMDPFWPRGWTAGQYHHLHGPGGYAIRGEGHALLLLCKRCVPQISLG